MWVSRTLILGMRDDAAAPSYCYDAIKIRELDLLEQFLQQFCILIPFDEFHSVLLSMKGVLPNLLVFGRCHGSLLL